MGHYSHHRGSLEPGWNFQAEAQTLWGQGIASVGLQEFVREECFFVGKATGYVETAGRASLSEVFGRIDWSLRRAMLPEETNVEA